MKRRFTRCNVLFVLVVVLAVSCVGAPESIDEPSAAEQPEPVPQPVEESLVDDVAEDVPGEVPSVDDVDDIDESDETFEITEELFERTFNEVEDVISELNAVIQRRDYRRWLSYLTREYVELYSDPSTLREISSMPILTRNEIELRSLEDYFEWVVAPSRANARLDDLTFLSPDRVEAIMVIQNRPAILYRLRNVEGRWKIDAF